MTDFIDQIWRSTANQTVPDRTRESALTLAAGFARRDARRRRRLGFTGVTLGLFTLGAGAALFDHAAVPPFGVLTMLALSWTAWALLAVQGRPGLIARRETLTLAEALTAMLRRNQRDRRSAGLIALVVAAAVAPVWMTAQQLQASGQATEREALQMGGLLTLALIGGAGSLAARLFGALASERRRLQHLVADHAEQGAG
jgi:hypothetical protein